MILFTFSYLTNVYSNLPIFGSYFILSLCLAMVFAAYSIFSSLVNTIFANMEAFKNSIQHARDNAKEVSRIGGYTAKALEQASRDASSAATNTAHATTTTSS
jgi:SNF family Na+-dependent transporter